MFCDFIVLSFRPVRCKYHSIGCQWIGPFKMQSVHECTCEFPKKSGLEVLENVHSFCNQKEKSIEVHRHIVELLSTERVAFVGRHGNSSFCHIPFIYYLL